MRKCRITIASSADGQENETVLNGELTIDGAAATLRYNDGGASVEIAVNREETTITRYGDYDMKLTLRQGEICTGTLGIMGSQGRVLTQTRALSYSVSERSLLLSARYDLLFGQERQAMKIRLHARF